MELYRPNGLIERLDQGRPAAPNLGYGRPQPGPSDPNSLRNAARSDRRRARRPQGDALRGRLCDLTA